MVNDSSLEMKRHLTSRHRSQPKLRKKYIYVKIDISLHYRLKDRTNKIRVFFLKRKLLFVNLDQTDPDTTSPILDT